LLAALNSGDETPEGPDYLAIYSVNDRTVTPVTSAELSGARNIRLQDLCPGRVVSHGQLVTDNVAVTLTVNAVSGAAIPGVVQCGA
jgi:hypothetical protein